MRLPLSFLTFALAILLTGCAYQGVVVSKNSEPSPLYHSVGIDGSYSFMLRDNAGTVRRQIVTPDVYALYEVGDYFNDLEPRREGPGAGNKNVQMASMTRRPASSAKLATATKVSRTRSIASTSKASAPTKAKPRNAVAKRKTAPARRIAAKPQQKKQVMKAPQSVIRRALPVAAKPQPVRQAAAAPDADLALMVSIPRCR